MILISPYVYPGIKRNDLVSTSLHPAHIISIVCQYFRVNRSTLENKGRKKEIVYARQICIYLLSQHTEMSLKSIGLYFGGRDHTTALHSRDKIRDFIAIKDPQTVKDIDHLKLML